MDRDKNIIFMGTPEFAVPALEKINSKFNIKAVVTVPDKPKGRGKKLLPPPVKEKALELGIKVLQPEKLKDEKFIEELQSLNPDIIVVIAFRILPPEVFNTASIASFNIHGSLLPKFRGAAPINWAIIKGEKKTGLTSFILKEKVDTGDILLKKEIEIPEGTTAGELHDMLMPMAADLAVETIQYINEGEFEVHSQDNSVATPAPKIFPDDCRIKWDKSSLELRNFIHGMSPFPGAWTIWKDSRMKIYKTEIAPDIGGKPGTFVIDDDNFLIQCGSGSLKVMELQEPGKKRMKIEDFIRGYRFDTKGVIA